MEECFVCKLTFSSNLFLLLCRLYNISILQVFGNDCKVHVVCFAFIKQMKCFSKLLDFEIKNNNVLQLIKLSYQ